MATEMSRMDWLINALGGEENLPPKLPTRQPAQDVVEETVNNEDPGNASKEDDVQQEDEQDAWWNATPRLPRQITRQSATPAMPSYNGSFDFDSRKGEPAPRGIAFSPFLAVTKFCYKFVKRQFQQQLATAFFDAGKIWNREWDLYVDHVLKLHITPYDQI
jgi:hypothetical protein